MPDRPALRYLSVCSGIEAASEAWQPRGWQPVAFSEVAKFPATVLAHRHPNVPNWGDMTRYEEWPDAAVDVLCGGTPCQSFSIAGLRQGLADPRGDLMLTYGAIAGRYRPRWLVWENVPGVLSSNGGRDFGTFLGMLGQLGYGVAYRVLDAEYVRTRRFPHAVPQQRRRVFVVGYLGDWRRAAAVLFDRESLSGHPPPRREAGQGLADRPAAGAEGRGRVVANSGEVAFCLTASAQGSLDAETEILIAVAPSLTGNPYGDNAGREGLLHAVAFQNRDRGDDGRGYSRPPSVMVGVVGTLETVKQWNIATPSAVRRLTPVECERLQGFPDGATQIPWRGKPADLCPDGPRYRAIGNSWPINAVDWLGERISEVDSWQ